MKVYIVVGIIKDYKYGDCIKICGVFGDKERANKVKNEREDMFDEIKIVECELNENVDKVIAECSGWFGT